MNREVILIRHAEVEEKWKTFCYGSLDVPLSERGIVSSQSFAQQVEPTDVPTRVYHSGLARTELLARFIADRCCKGFLYVDERLRERNYGKWHGLPWEECYASDPQHFQDLIDQPDTYSPPDGETTTQMQQRVVKWYDDTISQLPICRIIAVSHSGPIAALAGHLLGIPANQWQPWIIKNLESIRITSTAADGISVCKSTSWLN